MSVEARIGYIPGDRIGPVLTYDAALPVARKAASLAGVELEFKHILAAGDAYDATGEHLPDSSIELAQQMDAVIKAPVGGPPGSSDPKWKGLEKKTILPLRKETGVYANLRRLTVLGEVGIQLSPLPEERVKRLDVMIVRELTGGIYYGESDSGTLPSGERYAYETEYYTESQVERIVRTAVDIAKGRDNKLTLVHKSNVLEETGGLWHDVFEQSAKGQLDTGCMNVDAMAAAIVKRPNTFGTLVMPNMFGDILSDEGAEIMGSVGLGASASLGKDKFGLYEPMGGAAWDIENPDDANPIGMINSVAMMFRYSLGMPDIANAIEKSVEEVLNEHYLTKDVVSATKKKLGGIIAKEVNAAEFSKLVLAKMEEIYDRD